MPRTMYPNAMPRIRGKSRPRVEVKINGWVRFYFNASAAEHGESLVTGYFNFDDLSRPGGKVPPRVKSACRVINMNCEVIEMHVDFGSTEGDHLSVKLDPGEGFETACAIIEEALRQARLM